MSIKLPNGESEKVEFKTSFGKEVIESLCAFANASGGTVFVGFNITQQTNRRSF